MLDHVGSCVKWPTFFPGEHVWGETKLEHAVKTKAFFHQPKHHTGAGFLI